MGNGRYAMTPEDQALVESGYEMAYKTAVAVLQDRAELAESQRDALREALDEHCIVKDLSIPLVHALLSDTASASAARDERLREEGRAEERDRFPNAVVVEAARREGREQVIRAADAELQKIAKAHKSDSQRRIVWQCAEAIRRALDVTGEAE